MATYNKRGYKAPKEKEVNDTTVENVIIDEKDSTTAGVFSALDETASKTEDFVARNQKIIIGIVGAVALFTVGYLVYLKFIAEPKQLEAADEMFVAQQNFQSQQQALQNQQRQAMIGSLGSFGASAIGAFSDERLKEDIKKIGTSPSGLNIYSFKYKDKPGIYQGVIAQELQESNPKAVVTKDGFLAVDYSLIDVDFIKYDSSFLLLYTTIYRYYIIIS